MNFIVIISLVSPHHPLFVASEHSVASYIYKVVVRWRRKEWAIHFHGVELKLIHFKSTYSSRKSIKVTRGNVFFLWFNFFSVSFSKNVILRYVSVLDSAVCSPASPQRESISFHRYSIKSSSRMEINGCVRVYRCWIQSLKCEMKKKEL